MASPTQWTWVWVNSGSWWWTGRPGVLQSIRSQRVGQDWVMNWTELRVFCVMKWEIHIKHLCCWPSTLFIQWKLLRNCSISHTSHIFQGISFFENNGQNMTIWLCTFGKYYIIVGEVKNFPFCPSWVLVAGLIIKLSQNRLTDETVNFNFFHMEVS